MKNVTTYQHYNKYRQLKQGNFARLKEIALDLINNNVEGLKELFLEDAYLNNIGRIINKEVKSIYIVGVGIRPLTNKLKFASIKLDARIAELNSEIFVGETKHNTHQEIDKLVSQITKLSNEIRQKDLNFKKFGSSASGTWLKYFDAYMPLTQKLTRENRTGNSGWSYADNVSLLKHIMIYDILNCEFEEEKEAV